MKKHFLLLVAFLFAFGLFHGYIESDHHDHHQCPVCMLVDNTLIETSGSLPAPIIQATFESRFFVCTTRFILYVPHFANITRAPPLI